MPNLSMMRCPELLLCLVVGCASPPVVPLPVSLPTPRHFNRPAPSQPHYLTEDERQSLMEDITPTSDHITKYETIYWNELWRAFLDLNDTQQHLFRLMQHATTLQDFRHYRSLFQECVKLFNMMGNDLYRIKTTLKDIRDEIGETELDTDL